MKKHIIFINIYEENEELNITAEDINFQELQEIFFDKIGIIHRK
ncbi:MAG: hypothetical protein ACR5KW_02875 [Wolbachia sp.]